MDPIGNTQTVIAPAPALPTATVQSAPSVPLLGTPAPAGSQTGFDAQAAEQQRAAAVTQVAHQIANTYVLGDQTFSLFKDATGQYITRFTNLRDGKVTYIPEPTMFKLSGNDTAPVVKIRA